MTVEEFKEAVDKLMVKLNTPEIRYQVGVFIHDSETEELIPFGIGCPGCLARAVTDGVIAGRIKHIKKSTLHKEEVH